MQRQVYQCDFVDPKADASICTAENICDEDPRIANWQVDYSNNRSLQNWQQRLDLMCEPDWKASLLGAVWCLSWSVMLLWVPKLADKTGRKRIFVLARLLECACYTVLIFARDYKVVVCAFIVFGACSVGRINVGVVYLSEWFPTNR